MNYDLTSNHLGDRYLVLLSGVLLGYALIGKGFAYIGFPPIFIGEIAFFIGFFIFLRTDCLVAALTTLPSLFLAAAMAWVLLRTLPFIDIYSFQALRDSVVIMYGGFAFIVIALLLEDLRRVNSIIRYYGTFLNVYIPTIPFLYAFNRYFDDYIPSWSAYNIPLLDIRSGEVTTHLAGAAVFALAGFRNLTPLGVILVLPPLVMASVNSRGAMLAFVVPVIFAALVLGKVRQLAIVLAAGGAIFSAAYALETTFTQYREAQSTSERSLSTLQIVDNVASIFGRAGEQTEGTKQWRQDWWSIIVKDTLYGPHFWTGRGFGLNIAAADGFGAILNDHQPLRSPHNVHMTVLARAGAPGLALWGFVVVSWLGMLARAALTARRRGQSEWAGLFLFISCYVMSFLINATFDVALEGPMQGIWFWCLVGFGTGAVMIYRCQPYDDS